jgi:hypothetical protein
MMPLPLPAPVTSVAVGHQIRVDFPGGKGVHGHRVVEPLELHIEACFFEPAQVFDLIDSTSKT